MEKEEKHLGWELSKMIFAWVFAIIMGIYRALVITKIWALLIMGFMGLPAMPMLVAFGISLLMSLVTSDLSHGMMRVYMIAEQQLSKDSKLVLSVLGYLWSPIMYSSAWFMAWFWTLLF